MQTVHTVAAIAVSIAMMSAGSLSRAQTAADLTPDRGRMIVAPLYDALNEPSKKDIVSLLSEATNADYQSCSSNDECVDHQIMPLGT